VLSLGSVPLPLLDQRIDRDHTLPGGAHDQGVDLRFGHLKVLQLRQAGQHLASHGEDARLLVELARFIVRRDH